MNEAVKKAMRKVAKSKRGGIHGRMHPEGERRMNHVLKLQPRFAEAVKEGRKTFEVRKDDRDYKVGDTLTFTDLDGKPYGMPAYEVTYKLPREDFPAGLSDGYCVLSIEKSKALDDCIETLERDYGYKLGKKGEVPLYAEKLGENGEKVTIAFFKDGLAIISGLYALYSAPELEAIAETAKAMKANF